VEYCRREKILTIDRKPIRWLHLSDFHVGKDDYGSRKMFDYILAHVRKQKSAGIVPDFLFLTGDFADKGLEEQYLTFWLEFVDPLQTEIGDGIRDLTFAVPGNHDVDRNENQAF
jgi:3',5'-cyclic AMP phosphodiesterase CpdA